MTVDDLWVESPSDRARLTERGLPEPFQADTFEFWKSTCPSGGLPHMREIDPVNMPIKALPWVNLIKVEGPPWRFQIRIWGNGLTAAAGENLAGVWHDDAGMTEGIRRLSHVVEHKVPYFATLPMYWHSEKYKHSTHMTSLGMPFLGDDGTVRRILLIMSIDPPEWAASEQNFHRNDMRSPLVY
ncbi:MAG: hypothetical protein RIM33_08820 [Alphaproteobacteria bacterium]